MSAERTSATKTDRKPAGGSTDHRTENAKLIPLHGRGRLVTPWAPGQSGNPLGTPASAYNEARRICAAASEHAAKRQVELLDSADERIVLLAAEAVLTRGIGKPRDHSDEERFRQRINLSGLSSEELTSLGALLKKALGL